MQMYCLLGIHWVLLVLCLSCFVDVSSQFIFSSALENSSGGFGGHLDPLTSI